MKKVYIVGGDGFARECFQYIQWTMEVDKNLEFKGFLGHNGYGKTVDYKSLQKYYLYDVSEHKFQKDEYAIIGAAYPELRKKIYDDLKAMNIQMINLIPPFVAFHPGAQIGEGNIFIAPCYPGPDSKIGNGNVFNADIVIGHDVEVGDFNFVGGRSQILGGAKIGDMNQIGVNTIFLPKSKIGNNNKIAPLSAIYKGCKDNCYMQGNPALKVGNVDE